MGQGYSFHCSRCGYGFHTSVGVGILFPIVYEETLKAGREGRLGEDIREFLEEHPEGALDVSEAAYRCGGCGQYTSDKVLSMYLPKASKADTGKEKGRWSVSFPGEGIDYVAPWDLKEKYKFYQAHPHYCEACGGRMRKLPEKELRAGLKCPVCGEMMKSMNYLWD